MRTTFSDESVELMKSPDALVTVFEIVAGAPMAFWGILIQQQVRDLHLSSAFLREVASVFSQS